MLCAPLKPFVCFDLLFRIESISCLDFWVLGTTCGTVTLSGYKPTCARTGMSPHRYVPAPICPRTDMSPYRYVPVPICPSTDMSPHRYVPVPMCPRTYMSHYRYVSALICPRTYVPPHPYVPVMWCPTHVYAPVSTVSLTLILTIGLSDGDKSVRGHIGLTSFTSAKPPLRE